MTVKLESVTLRVGTLQNLQSSELVITTSEENGIYYTEKYLTKHYSLMGFGAIMRLGSNEPIDIDFSAARLVENSPKSSNQGRFSDCESETELPEGRLLKMKNDYSR